TADGHAPAGARRTDPGRRPKTPLFIGFALLLAVGSFGFAFLEAFDLSAGAWAPDFLDRFGNWFLLVSVAEIALVMVVALALFRLSRTNSGASEAAEPER